MTNNCKECSGVAAWEIEVMHPGPVDKRGNLLQVRTVSSGSRRQLVLRYMLA